MKPSLTRAAVHSSPKFGSSYNLIRSNVTYNPWVAEVTLGDECVDKLFQSIKGAF